MSLSSWLQERFENIRPESALARPVLTHLQKTFLFRLDRLTGLQGDSAVWDRLNTPGQDLIRRAIYSTYCDCVDLGVETEARDLLQRSRLSGELAIRHSRDRER